MVNRNGADEESEREREAIEDHVKTGKKKGPRGKYTSPLKKSVALAQKIKQFLKDNPGSAENMIIQSYTNDIDFPDTDKKYVADTLERMRESGMVQVVVVKSHHTAANDTLLYYPNNYYVEKPEPETAGNDLGTSNDGAGIPESPPPNFGDVAIAALRDSDLMGVFMKASGLGRELGEEERAAFRDLMEGVMKLAVVDGAMSERMFRGIMTLSQGEVARAKVKWEKEHGESGIIFDVKVGEDGRLTIPEPTREKYDLSKGKILTLKVVSTFVPPLKTCAGCGDSFSNYLGAQCQSCKEWSCAKCNLEHKHHYVCKVCSRRFEEGKGIEYNYEVTGYLCDACRKDLPSEKVSKMRRNEE